MDKDWSELLKQILEKQSLTQAQAEDLMRGWLNEEISPTLSGAILTAIQAKGVCAEELAGMASILQNQSLQSERISYGEAVIDTCGTGGDGASTFNISTAVAFVASAAGVKVAKHGNRSASSKVGSADVLEYLGIKLNVSDAVSKEALAAVGITFLFAPGWHPAMKSVAPIRKELKIRTIFNLLGPLVNPLYPNGQVIGVYDPQFIAPVANALKLLGVKRGIVLHGREKLDEAGLGDITDLAVLNNDEDACCVADPFGIASEEAVQMASLNPQELNLSCEPLSALKGGNVEENARILRDVLQGKGTKAQMEVVALNASLALQVAGVIPFGEHSQGIEKSREIIASGKAWDKLTELVKFCN